MIDEETRQRLINNFESASRRVASLPSIKPPLGTYQTADMEYSYHYQKLVKAGLMLQIKKKYRG